MSEWTKLLDLSRDLADAWDHTDGLSDELASSISAIRFHVLDPSNAFVICKKSALWAAIEAWAAESYLRGMQDDALAAGAANRGRDRVRALLGLDAPA